MKRAYKVNINAGRDAGKSYIVGGQKAGRFWSNDNKKSVRVKRKSFRVMDKIKVGVCIAIIASAWYMCWSNNHQPVKTVETVKAAEDDPALPKWKVFTSHDMPAYTDYFEKYFGDKAEEARKVASCESGNRDVRSKMNKNGTYDYGRMQINSIWLKYYGLTESQVLDEETNIATAKKIYDRSNNWSAWKSSKSCHHLN